MANSNDSKPKKKAPTGDYAVGFARPPVAGQIKPGEVRNRHGRNGVPKAKAQDAFAEAMNRMVPLTIDGKTVMIRAEEAIWLKHTAAALAGDSKPFRIIAQELRSRRSKSPPASTREEIEAQIAEDEEKKRISGQLIAMLTDYAQRKHLGLLDNGGNAHERT